MQNPTLKSLVICSVPMLGVKRFKRLERLERLERAGVTPIDWTAIHPPGFLLPWLFA
jgi:hypothetical protein